MSSTLAPDFCCNNPLSAVASPCERRVRDAASCVLTRNHRLLTFLFPLSSFLFPLPSSLSLRGHLPCVVVGVEKVVRFFAKRLEKEVGIEGFDILIVMGIAERAFAV